MAFQKGQSGNPGGRSTEKIWREAIMKAVRERNTEGGKQRLEEVATALVAAACKGDVPAIREIGDRLDGKVPQGITNEEGGAFTINIMRFTAES